VREWTLTPQGSFTLGSWSPGGLSNLQRVIARVKTQWIEDFFYINGKLLERRYLKWARIAHLNIWNTSYGQKKGWELNWQFDSQPLKVGNRPDLLACRWHATYHWKALNDNYNFALDFISILGLHAKLWAPKVIGVPTLAISGLPLGSPRTKCHLDVGLVERHKVYYKGEGGGFPQVRVVVSLVCPCCPWLILAPKVFQLRINHYVWVLCTPVWVNETCQLFLVRSHSSSTPLYPSKCYELGNVPQLLLLPLFSTWTHIWIFQGIGSVSNPLGFDPCNRSLNIQESTRTPTPNVGVTLGVWRFIPSHSLTLLGACGMTLRLPSWPATLQPLALVVSPRLGLRQSRCSINLKSFH